LFAAQQLLQQDVVDRIPERDRHGLAAQVGDLVDVVQHCQRGTVDVVPGHHLGRELRAVAHPQRGRRQQVDHIDLAGHEGFDDLGPAAEQAWRFGLQALGLEQLARRAPPAAARRR
jgi:hypothetical protein